MTRENRLLLATVTALGLGLGAPRLAHAEPEKAAAASSGSEKLEKPGTGDKPAGPEAAAEPPAEVWDIHDVTENPDRKYYFTGVHYRGNVIPAAVLHLFVEGGKTIYTNMVGVEFEVRRRGFSAIPSITYHELGTGDMLFKQKDKSDIAGNYSWVNSEMKILYASVDLLWSTKVQRNLDVEYGLGAGLGALFGGLEVNWVREGTGAGAITAANGKSYIPCPAVDVAGTGCNRADHQNAGTDQVGGYREPSWFGGGKKPVIFPWITPEIGLRFKPIKNFVGRLGLGWSLTGFWFGLSGSYGLEQKPKP